MAANSNLLGIALDRQGKWKEAVAAFREAIRLQPDFADAYKNMGLTQERRNQFVEALDAFREAKRLNPTDANLTKNLRHTMDELGMYDGIS